MSTRLRDVLFRELGTLRHEPTEKRIRGVLGGETVVDSRRALLIWEPKRVVPTYAVPEEDVRAEVAPAEDGGAAAPDGIPAIGAPQLGDRVVYDPTVPFAVHTTEGEPLEVRAGGRTAAAFRPADPDLRGHLVLDFDGFDEWYEEDERNLGHPRDPFHRVDAVPGRHHVRAEVDGTVVAESDRAWLLFEPPLPVRYYFPAEDVRLDLLAPSPTRTHCAYKGEAHYVSAAGEDDVAWTYPEPLHDASRVAGHYAFFNERVDLTVDGERLERPVTPWSKR